MLNSNLARICVSGIALVLLSSCGGGASFGPQPNPGGGNQQPAAGHPLDPARGDIAYSQVLRTASGLPKGINLTWTAQPGLTYNVYKSSTTIPASARGEATLQRATGLATGSFSDDFSDQPQPPQINETWFYRISAVDADGDESRLSAELQVDITDHIAQAVDIAQAKPGDQVTITGLRFGDYDAAIDKVLVSGATWTGAAPGGFDLLTPIEAQIDSWGPTSITVTLPEDFLPGPLGVEINGARSDSPFVDNTAPYLTSIAPLTGTAGTTVTLLGRNFIVPGPTPDISLGGQSGVLIAFTNTQIQFNPPVIHEYVTPKSLRVLNTAIRSNQGFFDLTNAPPVPSLAVSKALGYGSLNAKFDASASTDVEDDRDGTALTFDFDWDSDGTYDLLGGAPTELNLYSAIGTATATVRVTDSDGAQTVLSPGVAIEVRASLAGEWAMYGQGPGHTRRSKVSGPQASHLPRRKYLTGQRVVANPVFAADGTIYVGSLDGILRALNPDGTQKWRFPTVSTVGPINRAAAVGGDGTVYFADSTGAMFALDPATGAQKWQRGFAAQLSNMTISTDGTIYVGCNDRNLYALTDTGTGAATAWQRTLGNLQTSAPVIGTDGSIYAGNTDGRLYAFTDSGAPKWVYETTSAADLITGSIAINPATSRIYFGTSDGLLYSISDGGTAATFHWTQALNGAVVSSPGIGPNGFVYVGTNAGWCYGVQDLGTTALVAGQFPGAVAAGAFGSPAIGQDGKVYFGSANGQIYCLAAANLAMIWQFDTLSPINGSPSLGPDGALYVGYDNNALHAFGIPNPRPPTASLVIGAGSTTAEIAQNTNVDFTVTASSPENVTIVQYDFDFDADGTTDLTSASATENYTFPTFGSFTPTVKVTDENGLQNTLDAVVGPVDVWSAEAVANNARYVRIADTTGLPAIAYIVDNPVGVPDEVCYNRMDIGAGGALFWPAAPLLRVPVNSLVIADEVFDMALTGDGKVCIVFADGIQLRVFNSTDFGNSWSQGLVSTLGVLGYTDAAVTFVGQTPAVAFVMNLVAISGRICYSLALDTSGDNWNALVPNHIALLSGGTSCDLAMIDGHPALAMCGVGTGGFDQVQYLRANDGDGNLLTDWPLFAREVSIGNNLEECVLAEVLDPVSAVPQAAIAALRTQTQRQLHYMVSDTSWAVLPTPMLIHSGLMNVQMDMGLIGDKVCAAWGEDNTTSDPFNYFRAEDSGGTAWAAGTLLALADVVGAGRSVSIAEINVLGGPGPRAAVAFTTNTNQLFVCRQP